MRRFRLLCGGLLALAPSGVAWWPFGGDDDGGKASDEDDGMPQFGGFGMPGVVVVDSHFGFDPWEDLHKNMERVLQQSAQPMMLPGGSGGSHPPALALEDRLGGILSAFGDQHAGHFGRSGSFQVEDDHHSRFRITAELPGYKFGADAGGIGSDSPLSVRAVGRGSLVVSGMQQTGHMITSWQRSFALPKGCDINNISVTYSSASGNLTVDVPRRNITEAEANEEDDSDSANGEDFESMLPPALRAMQNGLPAILGQLAAGPGRMQGRRGGGGFLMPAQDVPDIMQEVFGMMGEMHPRFQPPSGGEKPVPEDAVVNLVGCFAESQLDKVELKYYGEKNAASFNAMYWHARSDHVPYFAMSRHEESLGHAFTAHGFVHESEKPEWGVYDGCGSRCSDDPDRWCGCANEASRGLGNRACPQEGEKRFAVYKIGEAPRDPDEEAADNNQGAKAERPAAPVSQGRPYWQLSSAENASDAPSIEIVVPKGTVAKAKGREVLLFNATEPAAAGSAEAAAGDASAGEAAASAPGSDSQGSPAPAEASAAPGQEAEAAAPDRGASASPAATPAVAPTPLSPTETPVGKMRLPVGVSPEACSWENARTAEDGGKVIKCQLDQSDVKSVPIKVIDEL